MSFLILGPYPRDNSFLADSFILVSSDPEYNYKQYMYACIYLINFRPYAQQGDAKLLAFSRDKL